MGSNEVLGRVVILLMPVLAIQVFLLSGRLKNSLAFLKFRRAFPSYQYIEIIRSKSALMDQSIENDFPELKAGNLKSDPNEQHQYWYSTVYEPNRRLKHVRKAKLRQRVYRESCIFVMLLTFVVMGAGIQNLVSIGSYSSLLVALLLSINTAFLIYMAAKMGVNLVVTTTKAEWANRYWQRKGVPKDQIHGTA